MGTLSLVLLLLSVQWSRAQEDPLLPFSEHLDPEHKVQLKWGFDEIQGTILFELTINTSGWVGFGFSPKGGMTGADIVIGGVRPEGRYFTDRHAGGNSMPVVDQQQNYKLLSLTESDGKTVMKFQRSIEACDENDLPITNLPMKLIYAYGQTDDITYHSNRRGTKELNLLKYMPRVNPPNSKYFDMTMVNFTVPANQTHYHCKIVRAPTFDRKQHIYRIEPVITNFDLVHHLLLYRCPPSVMEMFEAECYTSNRSNLCMETIAVWGVGGGAFEFPEVAGLPIGGNVGGFLYRLEVHYNNVNKKCRSVCRGRVDNSGLRFYYTSDLRQHDAAVLDTGLAVAPGYAIPPKAKSFLTYGLCDTAYIPEVLETPHDLQVFSVMLHTHLTGRKVRVGHFRGGKQIDFLAVDENYDFEYQDVMNLGKTKTVKLGDKLLVECTYNTENRSKLTWGGLSTSDEMCLAFLFYYPAMNLSGCMSFPNITTLISEMGTPSPNNWLNLMSNKIWNDTSINQYQQTLKRIEQHVIIADSFNNTSCNTGQIPDLSVIPSAPCISGCATKSLALLSLLLCLAVQFMQKYY
ncbi:DBH-like monooxygenase protein 2 homolog [Cyprinus carpio]|uniref:DBH-like monooxygenase protein 2 homolog n=1 Tax=Cyprinus carpio TaxID=7962 RepID=A0A9Q9Z965_CYPCA|nr:DBH-like monooxygenase protein 2 homolog [Cyprinus carpio]